MLILGVLLFGALGAVARAAVDSAIRRPTPFATLVINVSGSFLLGLLVGLGVSGLTKAVLATAFCGAYTTFSTFTFETVSQAMEGAWAPAARNVVVSVALGTAAGGLGLVIGSR